MLLLLFQVKITNEAIAFIYHLITAFHFILLSRKMAAKCIQRNVCIGQWSAERATENARPDNGGPMQRQIHDLALH